MGPELLEIQPRDLKFIFEVKKQSSCSVQLFNNSDQDVAFKVKTTSPKKYCVRPNIGVLKPKSICEFSVTMQAQRAAPPDMICKDKFLIQSTVVPPGTTDVDITPNMFAKDDHKYIQENKLKVILSGPPHSPVLSPINGTLKQVPSFEDSLLKDRVLSRLDIFPQHHTVDDDVEEFEKVNCNDLNLPEEVDLKQVKDVEELKFIKDTDIKDTGEMKTKLNELEAKLGKAEVTISNLAEERRLAIKERELLLQELEVSRSKGDTKRVVQVGFPFLFVFMVALIGVVLGYLLHH